MLQMKKIVGFFLNGGKADQIVLTRAIRSEVHVCDSGGAGTLSIMMQLETRKMAVCLLTPVMDGVGAVPKMIGPMIREDDERHLAYDERSSKGGMTE
ncbi:unnamed protein product [Heligmosomoides polygyrus]|uniref:Response regulatory domain-containing protein n=1 Tax=Heligmosomoides polygyrus TaxID=6339 RepID=A0A183FUF8_HELPZ|nr:unnamed protein product [Heligmosomoides polygyrus]